MKNFPFAIVSICIAAIPFLCVAPADAGETNGDGTTVVAEGAGLSPDAALKDAFRNAVRQVVGVYVSADSLVENDRLVDQVLIYSDGFVSSYRVLEDRHYGGIHRRTIAAVVERRPLLRRLRDSKLVIYDFDGGSIAAETLTRREAEQNATELLHQALENFPANVLEAEVVNQPAFADAREGTAQLTSLVRVSVDQRRYDTFRNRLVEVLQTVSNNKGFIKAWNVYVAARHYDRGNAFFTDEFLRSTGGRYGEAIADCGRFETVRGTRVTGLPSDWKDSPSDGKRSTVFVINTRSSSADRTTSWRWFEVPIAVDLDYRTARVEMDYAGNDGQCVQRDSFVLGPRTPGMSLDTNTGSYDGPRKVIVSPYVLYHQGNGYGAKVVTYARQLVMDRKIPLDISQLADVQAVHCRVTMNGQ